MKSVQSVVNRPTRNKTELLIDAVGSGEDVLISDEHSAAVLIAGVAQQRRHPRPFSFIGRLTSNNPGGLLRQLTTTCT